MLEHLRQRVAGVLADARTVTLSTTGPAGLQASRLSCESSDIELFVLVPRASDHLFNLETEPNVAVVNEFWSLTGKAHVLSRAEVPDGLALTRSPSENWSEVVQIHPVRVHLLQHDSRSPAETIDVE